MDFGSVLLGLQHGGKYRRSTWQQQHDPKYLYLGKYFDDPCIRVVFSALSGPKHVEYNPSTEDMLSTDWVGYPDKGKKNDPMEDNTLDPEHTLKAPVLADLVDEYEITPKEDLKGWPNGHRKRSVAPTG